MRIDRVSRRVRAARRREDGQVTTAIACIAMVGIVFVAFFGVTGLARGTGEKSKAQSAADAAALAGAKAIRDKYLDVPGLVGDLRGMDAADNLFSGFFCALGGSDAQSYAGQNEAHVLTYCYDAGDDRVRVRVEMNDPVSSRNAAAQADSKASVGFRPPSCRWEVDDAPDPIEPPPGPPDPDAPAPPPIEWPDTFARLDCGYFTANFTFDLASCIEDPAVAVDLADCALDLVGSVEVDEDAFSVRLEN